MGLTPPSYGIFLISLILAIAAVLVRYAGFGIPFVNGHLFETVLIAYVLLCVGVVFRGI
jgi:hypothetical protein